MEKGIARPGDLIEFQMAKVLGRLVRALVSSDISVKILGAIYLGRVSLGDVTRHLIFTDTGIMEVITGGDDFVYSIVRRYDDGPGE